MKPQLPRADELLPYLQRIDEARYYSNHGQLVVELEARLNTHFGLASGQVTTASNGTTALSAALLATGARPGSRCLLPSWTFVASAAAVWAANLQPHFIDVSESTWMLDPQVLKERKDLTDVGVVMVVSAFGAPVDTDAWDAFSDETGIPVVIDAAASFDTVRSTALARPGRSLMMISLHATKVFGTGEGAIVLSTDAASIKRVRQICNFGVWDEPEGQILGYNGKLSEYHAAVGLAALNVWDARRAELNNLTQTYIAKLDGFAGLTLVPGYGDGWVSCYCNIATTRDATDLGALLLERGVQTRRWWRAGVHAQTAYTGFSRDPLPVTERLGRSVIGLPFFHDLDRAQLADILTALSQALS